MKALYTALILLSIAMLSACGGKGRGVIALSSSSSVSVSSLSSSQGTLSSSLASSAPFSLSSSSQAPILSPQNPVAVAGDTQVSISWSPVQGATYNLYYATQSFSAITSINDYASLAGAGMVANIEEAQYLLAGLTNETLYYLVVTFVVDDESETSEMLSVTPMPANTTLITGALNDTGIINCSDYVYGDSTIETGIDYALLGDNGLNCTAVGATTISEGIDNNDDPVPMGQDALFGRDTFANDNSDGFAGFSFTQLTSTGIPLSIKSTLYLENPWSCILDNVTGLIWEVKTLEGLQDYNATYSWHNSTGINDGGSTGSEGAGDCISEAGCDVEKYVADINAMQLCGTNDWRVPTKEELLSLVNYQTQSPVIDVDYFPNTHANNFWTYTPVLGVASEAFHINFRFGTVGVLAKSNASYVRLVHGVKEPLL